MIKGMMMEYWRVCVENVKGYIEERVEQNGLRTDPGNTRLKFRPMNIYMINDIISCVK